MIEIVTNHHAPINIILKVIFISCDNNYYISEINLNLKNHFVDAALLMGNKSIWKGERKNPAEMDDKVKAFLTNYAIYFFIRG